MTNLAPIMQGFFTERLAQRRVSTHTIAAYRDTFRLLLRYAQQQLGRPPAALDLADINTNLVGGFLDHLQANRNNSITTRNARLAAIHSLFGYAALRHDHERRTTTHETMIYIAMIMLMSRRLAKTKP